MQKEKEDVARVENFEGVHNFARVLKMVEEEEVKKEKEEKEDAIE